MSLQETGFSEAWRSFITTTSALSTIYRMLGVAFIWMVFQVVRKQMFSAEQFLKIEYAMFAALVLIDLARARISHAAASALAPAFSIFMNFVHLFFKDAWIGGIIALVALFSPIMRKSRSVRMAAFALTEFSQIASVALGVAGVTGVYVVWLHLKSFSYVFTTDWGERFVVLSVLAAFLLLLRLSTQLYFEPKIIDATRNSDETRLPRIFSRLGFTLPAEMAIGIAILAVTSLLIITTPPLAPHYSFGRSTVSQGIALSLAEDPYESGKYRPARRPAKEGGDGREKYGRHPHESDGRRRPDHRPRSREIRRGICVR